MIKINLLLWPWVTAAGVVCVHVCPSVYLRLADFNMSELLDPPIETETSAESLRTDLIMILPSVWALVLCGSVVFCVFEWCRCSSVGHLTRASPRSHKVNIKPQQIFFKTIKTKKLFKLLKMYPQNAWHIFTRLYGAYIKRVKSNEWGNESLPCETENKMPPLALQSA